MDQRPWIDRSRGFSRSNGTRSVAREGKKRETRPIPKRSPFFFPSLSSLPRSLSALCAILLEALPRGSSTVKAATRPWRKMNFTPFEIVTRRVIPDNGAGCASDRLNADQFRTLGDINYIRRSNRRWWTDIGARQLASTMGDYFRTFVSLLSTLIYRRSRVSRVWSIARRFCTKKKREKREKKGFFENRRSMAGRKMARADGRRSVSQVGRVI